ncbi:ribosomal protein L35 (macronuclear) [Tetrahymena thermophila SB210]|uniref:Large ribosomal subunit protein uL29 n=1 Tax=Tetrahymena thermophila (strain SB210) TaxID=312017 RepID=RL35_TETTS|nr:ribosomal protein L35 [Tetrahymena thermophila SB210]P0DJ51.1 RecName: Full=Large ribosomal subunit protein uL29; AltName: Full=60S ribosomal protein L35 [Tetrahymena thermophila SB210]4V8P_BU Chain BU, RPL35 [Tetrahymena thermophila]4V8P_CU Chain CU, RPL35 [Tetrahymena thermophila]4V8P_EU Chain EU, RPL35 [Tetrahymena thermophila]4V8P_GU Chain GU, RPL35 [Tetrahymena thermophila]EAR89976.2 ribosomal protein L35 [Tetrahymena thermophila SB210]|eukprot:XP_001010221.2 ribosomal protein L35 [Tetrahymena thermophila SB210]
MDKSVRVFKLRTQTEEQLVGELGKLQTELSQLRIAKIAGGTANKLGRIGIVRKAIAKYLTIINEKRRQAVKDQFKGKSLKPLDIRVKKTRAIRRKLTKKQREAVLVKTQKKLNNFGLRKFALKA